MSDQRLISDIGDRYDARWIPRRSRDRKENAPPLRPNRILAARRWATVGCGAVALLFVAAPFVKNDHRAFQSRPVTSPHQYVATECSKCHDQKGRAICRLIPGVQAHTVSITACRACHARYSTDDHHRDRRDPRLSERNCAQCHIEHMGPEALFALAEATCAECHADLRTSKGEATAFAKSITSFQDHPEFALHARGGSSEWERLTTAIQNDDAWHLAWKRATIHPSAEPAAWSDSSGLKFNHARHVGDVRLPRSDAEFSVRTPTRFLDCGDCHEQDLRGAYFQPIVYERHCKRCHPLNLTADLRDETHLLPHGDPRVIRGILRDRLANYAAGRQADFEQPLANDGRRGPLARSETRVLSKEQWLEQMMRDVQQFTMRAAPARGVSDAADQAGQPGLAKGHPLPLIIREGCLLCHHVKESTDTGLGWDVIAPRIPQQWMPHSRFDHQPHAHVDCIACHYAPGSSDQDSLAQRIGSHATDVLMPSVEDCRQCHGGGVTQATAKCTHCHEYHHRATGRDAGWRDPPMSRVERAAASGPTPEP